MKKLESKIVYTNKSAQGVLEFITDDGKFYQLAKSERTGKVGLTWVGDLNIFEEKDLEADIKYAKLKEDNSLKDKPMSEDVKAPEGVEESVGAVTGGQLAEAPKADQQEEPPKADESAEEKSEE